jgi:type I restriction enzyme, S subunit
MARWQDVALGDVASLQRGYDITKSAQRPGLVPVVSASGVQSYHDTAIATGPGVVLARKGSGIGTAHYIDRDYWPHDTTLWVTDFHGNDPRFVYFLFKSLARQLAALDVGSANPTLNRNHLHPLRVRVPHPSEQGRIATALAALDEKIDLNRRMAATLSAAARARFKRLAGRVAAFDRDWPRVPFAETVDVISGGTPSTSEPTYWNGSIPWFTVADAPSADDVWATMTEKRITPSGLKSIRGETLPVGATIVTARGTVGRLALVAEPMAMNQSCYGLVSRVGDRGYFTYFQALDLVAELRQFAHGSIFDTITRSTLASVQVARLRGDDVREFEQQVDPLMQRLRVTVQQRWTLADMRDALLPRLVSGTLEFQR